MPACSPVHEIPESKTSSVAFPTVVNIEEFFTRYSSLRRLQRVIAYIFRLKNNAKISIAKINHQIGPLTVKELVKLARHSFNQEFADLKNKLAVHRKNRIFDLVEALFSLGLKFFISI